MNLADARFGHAESLGDFPKSQILYWRKQIIPLITTPLTPDLARRLLWNKPVTGFSFFRTTARGSGKVC